MWAVLGGVVGFLGSRLLPVGRVVRRDLVFAGVRGSRVYGVCGCWVQGCVRLASVVAGFKGVGGGLQWCVLLVFVIVFFFFRLGREKFLKLLILC